MEQHSASWRIAGGSGIRPVGTRHPHHMTGGASGRASAVPTVSICGAANQQRRRNYSHIRFQHSEAPSTGFLRLNKKRQILVLLLGQRRKKPGREN
jgi:hypothetical protein